MHYGVITNMAAIALIHLSHLWMHNFRSLFFSICHGIFRFVSKVREKKNGFRLFLEHVIMRVSSAASDYYDYSYRFLFLPSIFLFDWLRRAFLSFNAYTLSLRPTHTHSAHFHQIVKSYSLKTHISHHALWCRSIFHLIRAATASWQSHNGTFSHFEAIHLRFA